MMFIDGITLFFENLRFKLIEKGYLIEISCPTINRKKNSVAITISSNKQNLVVIIWETGEYHLDYLDIEQDVVWNKGDIFNNVNTMILEIQRCVDLL